MLKPISGFKHLSNTKGAIGTCYKFHPINLLQSPGQSFGNALDTNILLETSFHLNGIMSSATQLLVCTN